MAKHLYELEQRIAELERREEVRRWEQELHIGLE